MTRNRFQFAAVFLVLSLIAVASAPVLIAKSGGRGGCLVAPLAHLATRQPKRKFKFLERSCESGCVEDYESSDGQPVMLVDAFHSGSAADARRDMETLIKEGRVIKRGWQRNYRGSRPRVGERIVVVYPRDETGEKPAKIFWYHRGDIGFSYIVAGSLRLALDFERSDVGRRAWLYGDGP